LKLPRDESGISISKRIEKLGYTITRQTGSHIRLTTFNEGEHHVTVPAHKNLKIGTLNSILVDIASHFKNFKRRFNQKTLVIQEP
jgi:predicted RNA binding protein YcfA (HicA-like mRNA interferase family)